MRTFLFAIYCFLISYECVIAQSTNAEQPIGIAFKRSLLRFGTYPPVEAGTFLQFGPDQRLYTLDLAGRVKVYRIARKGNVYKVTDAEILTGAQQHPNHDDDGHPNPRTNNRVATSLVVGGTAANPAIYVGTTDPRTGGPNGDKNIDTNSGVITRIHWDGRQWKTVDLVRGLPRSEEYHGLNGMELANIQGKNYILINVGGNTNAGAPSKNFAYLCEVALSAAILAIDLDKLAKMPILTDTTLGRQYVYDVPTLDDPTRPNQNGIEDPAVPGYDGKDIGDPWGGNDGLNQGMLTLDGPVSVFASGFRNTYDLVLTQKGAVYTTDNGANPGWGGYPDGEGATANLVSNRYRPDEPGSGGPDGDEDAVTNRDELALVATSIATYKFGNYYGGHPNPVRANPEQAGLLTVDGPRALPSSFRKEKLPLSHPQFKQQSLPLNWPPVPVALANPAEADYRLPDKKNPDGPDDKPVAFLPTNSNGIDEYTSTAFGGALKGNLIVGTSTGALQRIVLNPDGSVNNIDKNWVTGLRGNPLGIQCNGDSDPFPGTIWIAALNNDITVLEPAVPKPCTLTKATDDDDQDGYTNADEQTSGSNPCSASSIPPDFDEDGVSDLLDSDDDNDGQNDLTDAATWGTTFKLPIYNNFFSDQTSMGGFKGLGMTGLMHTDTTVDFRRLMETPQAAASQKHDVYGGAAGVLTIWQNPGDALSNTQSKAFYYTIDPASAPDSFLVHSRMVFPYDLSYPEQSQGIFIGTGSQDDYIKLMLNTAGLSVAGEKGGSILSDMPALNMSLPKQDIDLYFVVYPKRGLIRAAWGIADGPRQWIGKAFKIEGPLLKALRQPKNSEVAVGIMGSCGKGSAFAASWDFLHVIPLYIPPPTNVVLRINAGGPTIPAIDGGPDWISDVRYISYFHRFKVEGGHSYDDKATHWANSTDPDIKMRTPFSVFDSERYFKPEDSKKSYKLYIGRPGRYKVRLFFRDTYEGLFANNGMRTFSVLIDGKPVSALSMICLSEKYGLRAAAVVEEEVEIQNNIISLDFVDYIFNPMISAIEIISLEDIQQPQKERAAQEMSPQASVWATPNATVDASVNDPNGFIIENIRKDGKRIQSLSIDLSTVAESSFVFDSSRIHLRLKRQLHQQKEQADITLKDITWSKPISDTRFHQMTLYFDNFDAGKSFMFEPSIIPNSVMPRFSPQQIQRVAGIELLGATITATFDNGQTSTGQLFSDGSEGGSCTWLYKASAVEVPMIEFEGLKGDTITNNASQNLLIQGPPNGAVVLVQTECHWIRPPASVGNYTPHLLEFNKVVRTINFPVVSLDAKGKAVVPVQLLQSGYYSGINQFTAVVLKGDMHGRMSTPVTIQYKK